MLLSVWSGRQMVPSSVAGATWALAQGRVSAPETTTAGRSQLKEMGAPEERATVAQQGRLVTAPEPPAGNIQTGE